MCFQPPEGRLDTESKTGIKLVLSQTVHASLFLYLLNVQ